MIQSQAVQMVVSAINRGNYGSADMMCRQMIAMTPQYPWGPYLLAVTANHLGDYRARAKCAAVASELLLEYSGADFSEIAQGLAELASTPKSATPAPRQPAYLIIKSWGYGFWSDVEHVMASLLLAEMTHRIPIVRWGGNSYYSSDETKDCFQKYFNPVSDVTLEDAIARDGRFYPPKWSAGNIRQDYLSVWEGAYSRLSGLYFFNRPERIAVSDFFTQVLELTPWLHEDHWLCGLDVITVMRRLYEKYFSLQKDIQQEVDAYIADNFDDRPVLGVHVRNEDKGSENQDLADENARIPYMIERRLARNPDLRIFLMTDRDSVIEDYRSRYGARVFHTDCIRTSDDTAVTLLEANDRSRFGIDIIKDTYAAAACTYFIGNGSSNIPPMIEILKEWPDGHFEMIGDNIKLVRNWKLHDW
ncbi:MAG: hypothetical protein HOM25_00235 [Rhodospirillaceae bacterium]|jgi:protein O-GlcNAc transferase|nr:hypothetical protein [Rhodospirillaceae bacterium]MBT5666022.1 hypothetical protein [Rhodospirillaceae bacterium]MBT5812659.1 hypothetical protein [Rhodospirillaceae bacterium]